MTDNVLAIYTEDLREDLDNLYRYSPVEYQYVIARSYSRTATKALEICGLSQAWLNAEDRRNRLPALADRLASDRLVQAEYRIREIVPIAIDNMVALMNDSKDDRVRFQATKDILDRAGVKATDKLNVELSGNVSLRSLQDVLLQVYGGRQGADNADNNGI